MSTQYPNTKKFKSGDIIFKEGENSKEAYILISGEIEVLKGDNVVVTFSEKGTFIGEMAVLLGKSRTATLRAKTDCEVGVVTKENFEIMVQKIPSVAFKLAKSLAERLEKTTKELNQLKNRLKFEDKDLNQNNDRQSINKDNEEANMGREEINTYLAEGVSLFKKGKYKEAIERLKRISEGIMDNSEKYMLYNNLGSCYFKINDFKNTLKIFAKALKLNPEGEEILTNFSILYIALKEYKKAYDICNRIINLFPDNKIANHNLKILKEMGEF